MIYIWYAFIFIIIFGGDGRGEGQGTTNQKTQALMEDNIKGRRPQRNKTIEQFYPQNYRQFELSLALLSKSFRTP